MERSDFAILLVELLDDTDLFNRKEWSEILNWPEPNIERWTFDEGFPSPETLRRVVCVVSESTADPKFMLKFKQLAKLKLEDISPCFTMDPCEGHETLEWYMGEPLRMAFERILRTIPSEAQEEVLLQAAELCRQARTKFVSENFNDH